MKNNIFALFAFAVVSGVCVAAEKNKLPEMSDAEFGKIEARFEERIREIRQTPNMAVPEKAVKRYVSSKGNDAADGTTPATAWRTIERLNREKLPSGAYALFERGGLYRGSVSARPGVTYTAYGEGDKPCITPSPMNGADPAKWEKTEAKDVWRCQIGTHDVGTIVFDGGRVHAIKIVPVYNKDGSFSQQYGRRPFDKGYADLAEDLHFWHDYSAKTKFKPYAQGSGWLYLRSRENPGKRFSSIEFCVRKHAIHVGRNNDVTVDNLCVMYAGAHGVSAGTVKNLKVTRCAFAWIGGSIQAEGLFGRSAPTRFGNAVEIWGGCENYTVENCHIRDVYDAALTHQYHVKEGEAPVFMKNVRYSRNVIERCNYSVEYFLSRIKDAASNPSRMENFLIEGNLARDAATGYCRQRPDARQGAHIKSWRYNGEFHQRNRAFNYVIENNVFAGSRDMMLEISSGMVNPDGSDSMPEMKGNVFIAENGGRFGVLNQGKAVELRYDGTIVQKLGERYSDNRFFTRAGKIFSIPFSR